MTQTRSHDRGKGSGTSRIPSPLSTAVPSDERSQPRAWRRRLWPALAGAALLALVGGLGLLHRHTALSPAHAVAPAAPEDPAEAGLRSAVEVRPNDVTTRLELGKYYEDHARPFEAILEYA